MKKLALTLSAGLLVLASCNKEQEGTVSTKDTSSTIRTVARGEYEDALKTCVLSAADVPASFTGFYTNPQRPLPAGESDICAKFTNGNGNGVINSHATYVENSDGVSMFTDAVADMQAMYEADGYSTNAMLVTQSCGSVDDAGDASVTDMVHMGAGELYEESKDVFNLETELAKVSVYNYGGSANLDNITNIKGWVIENEDYIRVLISVNGKIALGVDLNEQQGPDQAKQYADKMVEKTNAAIGQYNM